MGERDNDVSHRDTLPSGFQDSENQATSARTRDIEPDNLSQSPDIPSPCAGTNTVGKGKVKPTPRDAPSAKRVPQKGRKRNADTGSARGKLKTDASMDKDPPSKDNHEDSEYEGSTGPATAKRKRNTKLVEHRSNDNEGNIEPRYSVSSTESSEQATARQNASGQRGTDGATTESESSKRSVSATSDGTAFMGAKRSRFWYEEVTPVEQQSKQESPRGKGLRRKK